MDRKLLDEMGSGRYTGLLIITKAGEKMAKKEDCW
jgi:hypothetical protein